MNLRKYFPKRGVCWEYENDNESISSRLMMKENFLMKSFEKNEGLVADILSITTRIKINGLEIQNRRLV